MPGSIKKIAIGLGVVALMTVGLTFASRAWRARNRSSTAAEIAQFRGNDLAGHHRRIPVPETFVAPTPTAGAPREPVFSPDSQYVACRQPGAQEDLPDELQIFAARTGAQTARAVISSQVSVELFWPVQQQLSLTGRLGQTWQVKKGRAVPKGWFKAPTRFTMPLTTVSFPAPAHRRRGTETTSDVAVLVTNIAPQHQLGVRMLTDLRDDIEESRYIETFDTRTGHRRALFQPPDYSPSDISPFLWSPTGSARLLVSEVRGDYVLGGSLWDARTGQRLWQTHFDGFNVQLEWTPDARYLVASRVTGSRGRDQYPQHISVLVDARNGHIVRKLKAQNSLLGTAVSNRYLASFGYEKKPGQNFYSLSWALTDLRTGKRVLRCWVKASPPRVEELALSPDDRMLAGTSPGGLMVWKVAALKRGDDKPLVLTQGLSLKY